MPTRITLIGPGAIGGSLAAHLISTRRYEVTLAARTALQTLTLELPDGSDLSSQPTVITSPSDVSGPPPDWILVSTKAYNVAGTAAWLRALLGPGTRVAIIQNGVEHVARFQDFVPVDQLLPVMIDLPAERTAPGIIRQRGPGLLRVPNTPLGCAFVELFTATPLDAATSDDFLSIVWRKLTINAPGAVNALLLQPNGIVQQPAIAELMRGIMLETIAVARAEGAKLDDSLADKILESARRAAPDGVNSLHADRAAGRPMEVDARNGAVVRAGLKHGIPTPLNQMAVTLLNALQPTP